MCAFSSSSNSGQSPRPAFAKAPAGKPVFTKSPTRQSRYPAVVATLVEWAGDRAASAGKPVFTKPAALTVDEPEVTQVDEESSTLTGGEDGVAAVDGVGQECDSPRHT